MQPPITRVLLCEHDALVREALRTVLGQYDDLDVVDAVAGADDVLARAQQVRPHVVLLDRGELPETVDVIRSVAARSPATRILVRANIETEDGVYDAVRAGACGYLLSDTRCEQLVGAIHAAASGAAYLSPRVARRVFDDLSTFCPPRDTSRLAGLTDREREVLKLLARGYSNVELGERLFVSESTVKTHLSQVFRKLGVRDRVQAVIAAYETRLVRPGSGESPAARAAPSESPERMRTSRPAGEAPLHAAA